MGPRVRRIERIRRIIVTSPVARRSTEARWLILQPAVMTLSGRWLITDSEREIASAGWQFGAVRWQLPQD